MIAMLGFYICVSLIVALPFLARYAIVSFRERHGQHGSGRQDFSHHLSHKFLQKL